MSKADALIESKSLRETVIDRVDVLDKIKKLLLLPDDLHATVEMVASYYEVGIEAIKSTIKENRDELNLDGLKTLSGGELRSFKDLCGITSNTPRLSIIPKRAILRIGFFLRESEVAKTLRTYLLDKEEAHQPSNIVQIPTELNLLGQISDAISQSFKAMVAIQNDLTETKKEVSEAREEALKLKNEIEDVKNGLVDVNIPLRSQFNDAVRKYAVKKKMEFEDAYNQVYDILGKQNNVNIKTRVKNQQNAGNKVKPLDIVEELNLLVPAIRLAKTLAGVAI